MTGIASLYILLDINRHPTNNTVGGQIGLLGIQRIADFSLTVEFTAVYRKNVFYRMSKAFEY